MVLTKEAFLKRMPVKDVALSNGDVVYIRHLPASLCVGAEAGTNTFTPEFLIAESLCDEDGVLFFGDGEREEALRIPLADFSILTDAILALNGLTKKDGDATIAEKNSEGQAAT